MEAYRVNRLSSLPLAVILSRNFMLEIEQGVVRSQEPKSYGVGM